MFTKKQSHALLTKNEILIQCYPYVRSQLYSELEILINHSLDEDLKYIREVLNRVYDATTSGNEKRAWAICVAIDFLSSRLQYFGRLPEDFKTDFGIDLEILPETIAEWRDEKITKLIP